MAERILYPFAKPLYVMPKPVGAACNLACTYCYYLEKERLYPDATPHVMSDSMLERFVEEYICSQTMPQVLFTWHGGEPLLRPISFYQKALSLQRQYAGGRIVENCLQTNGTLLTDEWCRFFKDNHWLIGISIDGPQPLHDAYRKNRHGQPSHDKVMRGIELLDKHGVEWNAMAVVNDYNADYPLDFYRFFRDDLQCRYLRFHRNHGYCRRCCPCRVLCPDDRFRSCFLQREQVGRNRFTGSRHFDAPDAQHRKASPDLDPCNTCCSYHRSYLNNGIQA